MENASLTYGVVWFAGLASFFSPCMLPIFPSFLAYITGIHVKRDQPISRWTVNLTHMDTVEDAEKFKEKYGIPFPVLMDKKGEAAEAYKVRGTPTTVFIDTHGLIQDKAVGFPGAKALDKKIQTLIAVGEEDVHE
jgi:hypothetical protein